MTLLDRESAREQGAVRACIVTAHPDDDSLTAGIVQRIAREIKGRTVTGLARAVPGHAPAHRRSGARPPPDRCRRR